MHHAYSPVNRPLPSNVLDVVAERYIVRAIAFATGHSNPFTTMIWDAYSEYWPGVVKAWIADIPPTRRNLSRIFDLCEVRDSELLELLAPLPPSPLDQAADQVAHILQCEAAWASLFRLALYAKRTPAICLALDSIVYADFETLAECFSYVLQVPPGDIEIVLQRFDDSRPENSLSLREGEVPPSWIIRLIRAA